MKKIHLLIILFVAASTFFSQEKESEFVTVKGDSLVGSVVNGENIREVFGNVVITQGDVVITCEKAVQYIVKNEILLIGNVIATQDTLTLKSEEAYYYGDEKIAKSDTTVYLHEPDIDLTADSGKYFFNPKRAEFFGNVHVTDSLFNLYSQKLYYYRELEKLRAIDSVRVSDTTSVIYSDSLIHFRNEEISNAYGHVKVDNFDNNIVIFGDTLNSRNKENYSIITGEPLFIQIDTAANGTLDSLMIASRIMESYTDSTKKFIATDSVRIIRGGFSSINDKAIFYRADEVIETIKSGEGKKQPVLWYDQSQLVGDSVYIHLKDNKLNFIDIKNNAIIISAHDSLDWRYDQISGVRIKMFFNDSTIQRTEVYENMLSIYFLLEDGKPNGLIKSSSETGKIMFEDGRVVDVRLYGDPNSEYHPEGLIKNKVREFTLPLFRLYENRPQKSDLNKLIRETNE